MKKIALYMKTGLMLIVSSVYTLTAWSQTSSQNYIQTRTMLNASGTNFIDNVEYYDGIGRPVQTVTKGLNTSGRSVVVHSEYDSSNRIRKTWLPFSVSTSLGYVQQSSVAQQSGTFYSDNYAYKENDYDALDRIVFSASAGNDWHTANKGVSVEYLTNSANSVKKYAASMSNSNIVQNGYYQAATLNCDKTTDEDGHTIEIFTDKTGKKVLERRDGSNDTYFVYNDLEQLRFVLSPEYQTSAVKSKYAYEYEYDGYGNLKKKTLPGCEYIEYWYNDGDILVFSQDSRLRGKSLYRLFLYDVYGRPVVQGVCSSFSNSQSINTASFNGNTTLQFGGYTLTRPQYINNPQLEEVYYYDDYAFLDYIGTKYGNGIKNALYHSSQNNATGLLTGAVKFASNGEPVFESYYYDQKGNVVESKAVSIGGITISTQNEYSYTDKVTNSETSVTKGQNTVKVLRANSYHSNSDLLTTVTLTPKYNSQTFASHNVMSISYDNLGHVSVVARPGSAGSISYLYNTNGWLTQIQHSSFNEYLHYADAGATPCYNGNISRMKWTKGSTTYGYDFSYDGLNRLTNAVYGESESLTSNTGRYSVQNSYDKNSNITQSKTYGQTSASLYGLVDNLQMTYNGNQLKSVSNTGSMPYNPSQTMSFNDGANLAQEYFYDGCGALIADANKGIAHIEYDNLGYPRQIQFTNGNITRFVYAPDGRKLRTTHITAIDGIVIPLASACELSDSQVLSVDSTDYVDNFIYENGVFNKYLFGDGYLTISQPTASAQLGDIATPNPTNEARALSFVPTFYYYTKDHLGNVRSVVNESGDVLQYTHYYPNGNIIPALSMNASLQPYKYNGKELDKMHGLDWYDYGARNYDAELSRWDRIDPLCEKYYPVSPYAYCAGNPVKNVDPDGKSIWTKALKATAKIAIKTSKNGIKALGKAATYTEAFSGIVDDVNTLTSEDASTDDKVIAGLSLASELLPVSIGDVKDVAKRVDKVSNFVHGNSKISTKAQHAYDIIDKDTGKKVKTGVSGGKIVKGKSSRAESQVRKLNKEAGYEKYESNIYHKEEAGPNARAKILEIEKSHAKELRENGELDPKIHKRP